MFCHSQRRSLVPQRMHSTLFRKKIVESQMLQNPRACFVQPIGSNHVVDNGILFSADIQHPAAHRALCLHQPADNKVGWMDRAPPQVRHPTRQWGKQQDEPHVSQSIRLFYCLTWSSAVLRSICMISTDFFLTWTCALPFSPMCPTFAMHACCVLSAHHVLVSVHWIRNPFLLCLVPASHRDMTVQVDHVRRIKETTGWCSSRNPGVVAHLHKVWRLVLSGRFFRRHETRLCQYGRAPALLAGFVDSLRT